MSRQLRLEVQAHGEAHGFDEKTIDLARSLATRAGRALALTRCYLELSTDNTRDEVAALNARIRAIQHIEGIGSGADMEENTRRLEAELKRTQAVLADHGPMSGTLSFDSSQIANLPRRPSKRAERDKTNEQ